MSSSLVHGHIGHPFIQQMINDSPCFHGQGSESGVEAWPIVMKKEGAKLGSQNNPEHVKCVGSVRVNSKRFAVLFILCSPFIIIYRFKQCFS